MTAAARAAGQGAAACGGPWEAYTFKGEEFSVALPEMPALDHGSRTVKDSRQQKEPVRSYGAYGDGVVYLLCAYDRPRPAEDAEFFARYYALTTGYADKPVALAFEDATTLGGFAGRRYSFVSDVTPAGVPVSSLRVYVTRRHAYVLRAVGADDGHPCARRFFDSFTLTNAPAGRQIVDEWETFDAKDATPHYAPEPEPPARGLGPAGAPKTEAAGQGVPAGPFTSKEVTRKAALVSRPEPPYTERARKNQVTGAVMIRLVLKSDGKVGRIAVVSRLPDGLTERAIMAARHIKFIPAEKDGRRVSQYATIQYNFNIY